LRNKIFFASVSATVVVVISTLVLLSQRAGFSVPSRFEGKTVTKIEFVGIKKNGNGKSDDIVDIRAFNGFEIIRDQAQKNAILSKGERPEFDVIGLDMPLDPNKIRDTIKLLFREGKVSDVRVEVQEFGDGVLVRFYCEERANVTKISLKGLDKFQETEIKDKLFFKEGEPLRKDLIEKSLPSIKRKYFEAGLFNCVLSYKIDDDPDKKDGSKRVTIYIDEGEDMKIAKISILGAKMIPDYELRGIMQSKELKLLGDGYYKRDVLEQDKARIVAYYKSKGYLDAEIINDPLHQIEYEWDNPEDQSGSVRSIYITLKIHEGEKYYFDGYEVSGITGNVGDKDKGVFITKDKVESSFELKKKDPAEAQLDEKISNLYASATGKDVDTDVVFDNSLFEKDLQSIMFQYMGYGRIYTRVNPAAKDRYEERTINGVVEKRKYRKYSIEIAEGGENYIEKIYIRGLKKTKEKVVRRELLMKEESDGKAELFDSYKMQFTRERIFNLGYFKQVNIDIRPGTREGKVNIIIDVEEQPTGTVSVGGSWATRGGFSIFANVGDTNFMGNGQSVSVKVNYGPTSISSSINFTEPWLFDKPIALNAQIFYRLLTIEDTSLFSNSEESATYQKQLFGYSVGPTYRFLYFFGLGFDWTHTFKNIVDASGNCSDEVLVEKKLGFQEKRAITTYATFNNTDNSLNPTKGASARLSYTFVGGYFLRGDDHYMQFDPSLEMYYTPFTLPFLKDYPCVIQIRGSGSFINPPFYRNKMEKLQPRSKNEWLDSEDRLRVGGPGSLRGWDYYNDYDLPESWRNGLYHELLYGAEFRVPIVKQYLWMTFFFDAASLWTDKFWEQNLSDSDKAQIASDKNAKLLYDIRDIDKVDLMSYFRYSYGFGFKIQIPMMPLRLWFGKKAVWAGAGHGYFRPISGYNFQFAIGDMQF
jgi:outer membrane protein insertion porin family